MTPPQPLAIVMTTVESSGDANTLATALIEQSLAACVQVDGPITSYYRWAGRTETSSEFRLMIKTSLASWPAVKDWLAKKHPYDEPEIILMHLDDASEGYRDWLLEQTK